MDKIILSPYRIIPCDYGHQLDEEILEKISKHFNNNSEYEIISDFGTLNDTEVVMVRYKHPIEEANLFLNIYSDGIGIFTLVDKEESYALDNFDPRITLDKRKTAHREILTHTHQVSKLINDHIYKVRSFFGKDAARLTASNFWEKRGLSYVMSFYFINCDIGLIAKKDFYERLTYLLFPFSFEHDFDYFKEIDIKKEITQFRSEFIDVAKQNSDISPYIHTCASWSNFLVIGKISDSVSEYWKLERDFQHVWFYAYITDKFIENSLKHVSAKTTGKRLELLDSFLTKMTLIISQYEGIMSSTLHERDFKLYNTLKTTSRLDILVKNIEKKSTLLKDRLNWLLTEKRFAAEKKIQLILFIIAIVSFMTSWEKFMKFGIYNIGIITLISLAALYFFKTFFHKKDETQLK